MATKPSTGRPHRMFMESPAISAAPSTSPLPMSTSTWTTWAVDSADSWGIQSAQLSKDSGGKPVKLFLDRATELTVAGNRPSDFSKVKVAGKKDGTITAWQSETWSTGGVGGGNLNAQLFPYIFTGVPNRRINHTADRKSTRLNSSHSQISYAVFCLKKK